MIAQRVDKFRSTIVALMVGIIAVILMGTMAPALGMTGPAEQGAQRAAQSQATTVREDGTPVEPAQNAPAQVQPAAVSTPPEEEPTGEYTGPPLSTPTDDPDEGGGEESEESEESGDNGGVTKDTASASPASQGRDAVSGAANETLFGACNYLMYCRWAASVKTPAPSGSFTNISEIPNSTGAAIGTILFALTGMAYLILGIIMQIALSIDVVSKGIFISDYVFAHLISGSLLSSQGDVADEAFISSGQVVLGTVLLLMFIAYAIQFGIIPTRSFTWGPFAAAMATRRLIMSLIMSLALFGMILIMSYAAQRNHPEFNSANPAPIAEQVGTVDEMSALGVGVRGSFGDDRIQAMSEPSNWAIMSPGWMSAWTSKVMYSIGGVFTGAVNSLSSTMVGISDRDSIGTCTYYTDAMHSVFRSTPAARGMGGRGEILITYDQMVRGLHFNNFRMAFGSSTVSSSNSWCRAAEAQAESPIADQIMISRTAGLYKELIGVGSVGPKPINGANGDRVGGELVDKDGNWTSPDAQVAAGTIFGPYFESQDTLNRSSMYFAVCQWTPGKSVSINGEWHGVQWYDTGDQGTAVGNLARKIVPFSIAQLGNMPEFDAADPTASCVEGITDRGLEPDEDGMAGWFTSDGFEGPGRFGYLDGAASEDNGGIVSAVGSAFGFSDGQYQPFFVKDNGEQAHEALNYVSAVNGKKGAATMFLSIMSVLVAFLSFKYFGPLVIPMVIGNLAFILALGFIWVAMVLAIFPFAALRSMAKGVVLTMVAGQIVSTFSAFLISAVLLATAVSQLLIAGLIPIGGNPWLRSLQYGLATIAGFWAVMTLIKNSSALKDRGLNNVGNLSHGMAIGKTAFAPVINSARSFTGNDKIGHADMKTPWSKDFWWGEKKDKAGDTDIMSDATLGNKSDSKNGNQKALDRKGFLGIGKGKGDEGPGANALTKGPKDPKDPNAPKGAAALTAGDKAQMRTNPTTGKREYLDPKTGLWKPADSMFDKNAKDGAVPLRTNPATGKQQFLDPQTGLWKDLDSLSPKEREDLLNGKMSPSVRINPETGEKEYLDTKTGEWISASELANRDLDRKSLVPGYGSKQLRGVWEDHERSGKIAQKLAPIAEKIPGAGAPTAAALRFGGLALEKVSQQLPGFMEDSVVKGYELRASRLGNMPQSVQDGANKALEFGDKVDPKVAGALSSSLVDESNAQAMNLASNSLPLLAGNDVDPGSVPTSLLISGDPDIGDTVLGNSGERVVDIDLDDLQSNAQATSLTMGSLAGTDAARSTFTDPIDRAGSISSLGMADRHLASFVNEAGDPITPARMAEEMADSGQLGFVGQPGSGVNYDPSSLESIEAWASGNVSSAALFDPSNTSGSTIHIPGVGDDAGQTFSPAMRRYTVDGSTLNVTEITGTQVGDFSSEQVAEARSHVLRSMEEAQSRADADAQKVAESRNQALADMWNKARTQIGGIASREDVNEAFTAFTQNGGPRPTVQAQPERFSASPASSALEGQVIPPSGGGNRASDLLGDSGGFKDTARTLFNDPEVRRVASNVSKKAAVAALKMFKK